MMPNDVLKAATKRQQAALDQAISNLEAADAALVAAQAETPLIAWADEAYATELSSYRELIAVLTKLIGLELLPDEETS